MRPIGRNYKDTVPNADYIAGNPLFDRAVFAIGLDGVTTRMLLREVCMRFKQTPHTLTSNVLSAALLELDARIRLLVPEEIADRAMWRLRQLVLRFEG
jgi:hypothetical protein